MPRLLKAGGLYYSMRYPQINHQPCRFFFFHFLHKGLAVRMKRMGFKKGLCGGMVGGWSGDGRVWERKEKSLKLYAHK